MNCGFSLKVSGPSGQMTWIRGGPLCMDAKNIKEALDGRLFSLSELFGAV